MCLWLHHPHLRKKNLVMRCSFLASPLRLTKESKGRNIRKTKRQNFMNLQKPTMFSRDQPGQA
jgi:hypothetical protein